MSTPRDPERMIRYQGKNLAFLMLALCVPVLLLYLRLVFGMVASDDRFPARQALLFGRSATFALLLFFVAQIGCARYIQRLLPEKRTGPGKFLQYVAVLALCLFLSVTGTVILEAIGFNVWLRSGGLH